jgi:hypothetical protein
MMQRCIIRQIRIARPLSRHAPIDLKSRDASLSSCHRRFGTDVVHARQELTHMMLTWWKNPAFWDKKIRIAILTLATFIALC